MRRFGRGARWQPTRSRRVGWVLALAAVFFQLIAPMLQAPVIVPAGIDAELAGLLAAHALCLSGEASRAPPQPAPNQAPEHTDHRFAACCPWHGYSGQDMPTPVAIGLVAFGEIEATFAPPPSILVVPRPPGTAGARAPPIGA